MALAVTAMVVPEDAAQHSEVAYPNTNRAKLSNTSVLYVPATYKVRAILKR